MPISKLIANYTDPVFNDIKSSFGQRSDDFPVTMLPVRLETRFMNETRFVSVKVPGKANINVAVQKMYKLLYDIHVWLPKVDGLTQKQINSKLAIFKRIFKKIQKQINALPEIPAVDRQILREAMEDVKAEFAKFSFPTASSNSKADGLRSMAVDVETKVNEINAPADSVYKKGYAYLAALERIEDSIDAIYVKRSISPMQLDAELNNVDEQINTINSLIQESDFRATTATQEKIKSKISFIKRQQKNSPIRLLDFKIGYAGSRNLKTDEYALRGDINALKAKIDEEHVPFMALQEDLKSYPTRRLTYRIDKAYYTLRGTNRVGYKSYAELMTAKLRLYDDLHGIRERAHRPLDGEYGDIGILKSRYALLVKEVNKFIKKSKKIKPADRYQKAALTRLNTHLTEEYLEDLHDLLPGIKTVEEQAFGDSKVRVTSNSAFKTSQNLTQVREYIKSANGDQEDVLHNVKKQLQEAKARIAVSASNTILLPRKSFLGLQSTVNSLKSHVDNMATRNNIAMTNPVFLQNKQLVHEIENSILNQQTDVFDQRDLFYDDYRKKITFTLKTETVKELWVRIYPDDIAIDNHDERITDEEESLAQDYYFEVYRHDEDEREGIKMGAWRAAAASLGVRRAAYILKALEPNEVKNNSVANRKNEMSALLKQLSKFVPRKTFKRFESNLANDSKFVKTLKRLPGKLQNALEKAAFDACLENKTTLDTFLSVVSRIGKQLEKEFNAAEERNDQEQIQKLADQLKRVADIVIDYYKRNLESLNQAFKPLLTFPLLEKKDKSWDRAGITEVMPDRFVVVTKRGGVYQHIVTSKVISKPLQVSIDPSGDQADRFSHTSNGDLNVPDEIKWLFDFDAAVDAGMAVRIPLQDEDFEKGFELVMALGVQDTGAEAGQETINKLLKNHLYSSGGLEYLPVGTATNNTEDVKSPYRSIDNDFDGAFELFFNQNSPTYLVQNDANELKITDGQFFKDALGLPNDIADFIRNNEKMDIVNGRAMNRALYNSTIKYYLSIMVNNLVNSNDIGQTLPYLMTHVSAIGLVPSFRVDQQPYGVLPITTYRDFKVTGSTAKNTEGSFVKQLTIFLNATRNAFDAFSKKPQTVNGEKYKNDPQKEFLKILGLEPHSKEFFYRFGTNISSRWSENPDDSLDFPVNWDNIKDAHTPANVASHYDYLLKGLGHTTAATRTNAIQKSKAYVNRYMHGNYMNGPLVQDHELGTEKLSPIVDGSTDTYNYIDWLHDNHEHSDLRKLEVGEIPKVSFEGEEKIQNSLLFLMLRGGLLYDHSNFALRTFPILSNLDVLTLERLLANHIDLCSYRLDAWLNSLANYRLKELRTAQPEGTYVGAYGFVQDLKPAPPQERAQTLPAGLTPQNGAEVFKGGDNQGFIHGPSMNHAIAAAVLRAGYNSLKSRGNNNNALAINLSSSRVRKALSLLEGVSNGQEPGALLGYMLERALHDKYKDAQNKPLEMDVYIYRLRRKFPTFGDMPKDNDINLSQDESVKPANVVDGLAMIDHFEKELESSGHFLPDSTFVEMMIDDSNATPIFKGYPWGFGNEVPNPSSPPQGSNATLERLKLRAIIHELDNMADAFDSLGDLMTAEGVYQLVRGNHVRASAVLNALADGKVPLDPEIIKSMRQGVMVTHRVSVNIPVSTSAISPWNGVPMSPRALAEPSINNWLATQIGMPDHVDWFAKFGETETHLTLEDLGLQPIDLVLVVTAGGEDGLAEIEQRCIDYLRLNGATADDSFEFNFNIHSPVVSLSFGEIVSLLQNLGKTITAARPADARDFRIAEDEANFELTAAGLDTTALSTRMNSAFSDYQSLLTSLAPFEATKESYNNAETTLAIGKLKELCQWGFNGFYPTQDDREEVLRMAGKIVSAKAKMQENVTFIESALAALELELDHAKWMSSSIEICTRLFGNGFKMLPEFSNTNSPGLRTQLDFTHDTGLLRNKNNGYLNEWLSSAALVRSHLVSVETLRLLTDSIYNREESIQVAQLPFEEPADPADRDYWLGAEYPDSFIPDGDRLSLVCIGQENVAASSCGLILDEWMEIIPDEKETTGIALHYNQPDARAPQTILLAVTAEKTGSWNIEDLALTVEEALNMARLRSVEPEHVDFSMFSQLLPATATLAFGFDEMARRLFPDAEGDNFDQELGLYIDYTAVNHGVEPEEIQEN